nr:MAG TPA: hypothetical protein [Bacteriophage sp.]
MYFLYPFLAHRVVKTYKAVSLQPTTGKDKTYEKRNTRATNRT